jgi:biotin carboxyl carrier protein
VPAGANTVAAPLPGTIVDVKVSVGQAVKRGDVLFVLEAMKMENDIPAAADGTVTAIQVQKGSSVNSGDVLCALS